MDSRGAVSVSLIPAPSGAFLFVGTAYKPKGGNYGVLCLLGFAGGRMDYFASLMRFVLFVVVLALPSFSFGQANLVMPMPQYSCGSPESFGSSPGEACAAFRAKHSYCKVEPATCTGDINGTCSGEIKRGSPCTDGTWQGWDTTYSDRWYLVGKGCPSNSTQSGSGTSISCTCDSGFKPNASNAECIKDDSKDPPGCKFGTSGTRNFTTGWSRKSARASAAGDSDLAADEASVMQAASFANTDVCDGKCSMSVGSPSKAWHSNTPSASGMYRMSADFNVTFHGACSADQKTTPGTRPNEIPAACDGFVGQVNGETTCVKNAYSRPDTKQSYGTPLLEGNPAASTSSDQPAADRQKMPEGGWGPDAGPGGPSGGPPSASFGSPRGAGGLAPAAPGGGSGSGSGAASSPGGAPGSADPGSSYCQQNPTATVCKPASFSGACAGGFTCSGDAVSCAMAREQYNRNCAMFDIETPLSMKGRDYVGWGSQSTPPGHPGAAANVQNTTFAFSSLISQDNQFGSSCPNDRTFSGAGTTFVIPFSELCGSLQLMGQALVAICMLGAVAIVFRGGN